MQPIHYSKTTIISTISGTILSVFNNITPQDLVKTAVLAAVGAATSFLVSVALRWLLKKMKSRKNSLKHPV